MGRGEALIVVLDNSLYMQNQDYLPSRLFLEREVCYSIKTNFLARPESYLGIAPMSQPVENYFLTPTNKESYITNFLNKISLSDNLQITKVLTRCRMCLRNREEAEKKMLIFLGSDIDSKVLDKTIFDLISNITECIQEGIKVSIVLFGEKRHVLRDLFTVEYFGEVAVVDNDESFLTESLNVLGMSVFNYEDDPDLALAIKLSMEEEEERKRKELK
ncbi:hypothetical protein H312_01001 [Anncaliia algerae PRA339]|uniref:VWFA domain-containing protein n=1 Tax=Anncaliia algerae PRA339 TaxID=1288291 RepID=A0A059F2T7_9MICR|nr:hypothetical protein H312_01001 [Anncaliia algerae PRA339]